MWGIILNDADAKVCVFGLCLLKTNQISARGRNRNILNSVFSVMCYAVPSRSAAFDSLWPHGLQPARLLCPWNSPGKNTGVGSLSLLQGIFLTLELNWDLPHCWRRQWTEEPGRLPSMGLDRVGHDWSDLVAAAASTLQVNSLPAELPGKPL